MNFADSKCEELKELSLRSEVIIGNILYIGKSPDALHFGLFGGTAQSSLAYPPLIRFFRIAPPGLCTLLDAPTTTMLLR